MRSFTSSVVRSRSTGVAVERVASRPGATSAVITSGWFREEFEFPAADHRYTDDAHYLAAPARSRPRPGGVQHPRPRASPRSLARRPRALSPDHAGLRQGPHGRDGAADLERDLGRVAARRPGLSNSQPSCCRPTAELPVTDKIQALLADDSTYASNLVDVGNTVDLRRSKHHIDAITPKLLRCKNLFSSVSEPAHPGQRSYCAVSPDRLGPRLHVDVVGTVREGPHRGAEAAILGRSEVSTAYFLARAMIFSAPWSPVVVVSTSISKENMRFVTIPSSTATPVMATMSTSWTAWSCRKASKSR
jgi:hypothetical protein